jgi:hypothetical protein
MTCAAVTILWLLLLALPAAAQISGNDWRTLPLASRAAYVLGVVNGWQHLATLTDYGNKIGGPPSVAPAAEMLVEVVHCLDRNKGMTNEQIVAIVEKYMKESPAEWHYGMPSLIWAAIHRGLCGKPAGSERGETESHPR